MAEYIEREALIHHFMTKRQYLTKDLVLDAVYEISQIPAADAAPVRYGKWDVATDGDGVVCSICGEDFCNIIHETDKFHYCPNCSAYMGGADNGE